MRHFRYCILLVLYLFSIPYAKCQEYWTRNYGGTQFDEFNFILDTGNGTHLLLGSSDSKGWMVKINAEGDTLWTAMSGDSISTLTAACLLEDASVIAIGNTRHGYTSSVLWATRVSSEGVPIWSEPYPLPGFWSPEDIIPLWDEQFLVVGWCYYTDIYSKSAFSLQINTLGDTSSTKIYDQTTDGQFHTALRTDQSEVYIAGLADPDNGPSEGWLVKIDSSNNITEEWRYPSTRLLEDIIQTSPERLTLVGSQPATIIEIDLDGNVVWENSYEYYALDVFARSICVSADRSLIISGAQNLFIDLEIGIIRQDAWILKVDSVGNVLWEQFYGSSEHHDWFKSMVSTGGGSYLMAGATGTYSFGNYDGWVVKIDSLGNTTLPLTIKDDDLPKTHQLVVYPNPTNGSANIIFNLSDASEVTISIYDVRGKQIGRKGLGVVAPGVYSASLSDIVLKHQQLTSGLYFVQIQTEFQSMNSKFVLVN